MSLFGPTLVLYLMVGVGVAAALYLADPPRPRAERVLRLATAVPFWPFLLPILLAGPARRLSPAESVEDELTRAIARVEAELDGILAAPEKWLREAAERQREQLDGLRAAWRAQAGRIREMGLLLARSEYATPAEEASPALAPGARQSLAARRQNLERLARLRQRSEADLLASLALVRELVSRIHLARFTDAPEARVGELLAEIAATVESLSAPVPPDQTHSIRRAE